VDAAFVEVCEEHDEKYSRRGWGECNLASISTVTDEVYRAGFRLLHMAVIN
jgi:hypothetical protein